MTYMLGYILGIVIAGVCVIGVVLIVVVGVKCLLKYARNQERHQKQTAWDEGAQWCIRVHAMRNAGIPAMPAEMPKTREDAWKEGYLSVLDINKLPITDVDREELHHNPYTTRDAAQTIAAASVASSINISNSIHNSR